MRCPIFYVSSLRAALAFIVAEGPTHRVLAAGKGLLSQSVPLHANHLDRPYFFDKRHGRYLFDLFRTLQLDRHALEVLVVELTANANAGLCLHGV